MILRFYSEDGGSPNQHWGAATSDGMHDAVGATPLDAAAALVEVLEKVLAENRRTYPAHFRDE